MSDLTVPWQETKISKEKEASFVAKDNFAIVFDEQKPRKNADEEKESESNTHFDSLISFIWIIQNSGPKERRFFLKFLTSNK